jgi:hypothetical protein
LILRKTLIASLAAGAAIAMSACGSDSNEPQADATTTTAASAAATCENPPPPPTSEDLQGVLDTALNPEVPADEKADLIEGGADDPQVWDQLATKIAEAQGVEYQVSTGEGAITMIDDCNASVGFTLKLGPDAQPTVTFIDFVAEDGKWKLSRKHACQLVNTMAIQTDLCPAA